MTGRAVSFASGTLAKDTAGTTFLNLDLVSWNNLSGGSKRLPYKIGTAGRLTLAA